jgi:hypothetical protein
MKLDGFTSMNGNSRPKVNKDLPDANPDGLLQKTTKKMKKIYLAALVCLATFLEMNGQRDPHYTQYMYNMNVG